MIEQDGRKKVVRLLVEARVETASLFSLSLNGVLTKQNPSELLLPHLTSFRCNALETMSSIVIICIPRHGEASKVTLCRD